MRGGGKLTFLPLEATPSVSEIEAAIEDENYDFLNERKTDLLSKFENDLRENWRSYIVSAHGELDPRYYDTVPENTYILFNSPAGCFAEAPPVPYSNTTVASSYEEFLKKLAAEQFRSLHYIFDSLAIAPERGFENYKKRDFLLKTLSPNIRKKKATVEGVFPVGFNTSNNAKRSARSELFDKVYYGAKTIYGPGEKYPRINIEFANYPGTTIMLGIYELPIPAAFYEEIIANALAFQKSGADGEATFARDSALFTAAKGNLGAGLLGRTLPLRDVLPLMPREASKKRFIYVTACRSLPFVAPSAAGAGARPTLGYLSRMMRVASIANNNSLIPHVQAAAQAYFAPAESAVEEAAAPPPVASASDT